MQTQVGVVVRLLVLSSLLGGALWSPSADAATVLVQTTGNPLGARDSNNVSAQIYILVTNPIDGSPISTLGNNGASLPNGWSLQVLSGNFGGAGPFIPSTFSNQGNGAYSVVIFPPPSFCPYACGVWARGEYHYAIRLSVTVSGTTYQGSGLGVFVIP